MNPLPNCFVVSVGHLSYFWYCVPVISKKYNFYPIFYFLICIQKSIQSIFLFICNLPKGSISYHTTEYLYTKLKLYLSDILVKEVNSILL